MLPRVQCHREDDLRDPAAGDNHHSTGQQATDVNDTDTAHNHSHGDGDGDGDGHRNTRT